MVLSLWIIFISLGAVISVFYPSTMNIEIANQSLSISHPLGTDSLGRDYLLRIFEGSGTSLFVGLGAAFVAVTIGFLIGTLGAFGRRGWQIFLTKVIEIFSSIPSFILVSVFVTGLRALSPELDSGWVIFSMALSIGFTQWTLVARVVRAKVLELREQEFIVAARALGGGQFHILFKHLLPHVFQILKNHLIILIPACISYEAMLSFIGLGPSSPATSWGILIKEAYQSLSVYPHLVLAPSIFLFFTVWAIHHFVNRKKLNANSAYSAA